MRSSRKAVTLVVCLLALTILTCQKTATQVKTQPNVLAAATPLPLPLPLVLAPKFSDYPDIPGGAPNATLQQAAVFAWLEFVAATWPAQPNGSGGFNRDTPDAFAIYGASAADPNGPPLVWETFRHKVEIFPGTTDLNNYQNNAPPHGATKGAPTFGYNDPPQYNYATAAGLSNATAPVTGPCAGTTPAATTPWVNLDENSQIFLDMMYAGVLGSDAPQQILFMAKANSVHYQYVVNPANFGGTQLYQGLWNHSFSGSTANSDNPLYNTAVANFISYAAAVNAGQPASLQAPFVSFPAGTVEVKSAWRPLTSTEAKSGRFHVAMARHYEAVTTNTACYVDEPFGLLALHIIQKTPSAPYFVFATFSQADNIVDVHGTPVEDAEGRLIAQNPGPNLDTGLPPGPQNPVVATQATPVAYESYNVQTAQCQPNERLYLYNTANTAPTPQVTPQGPICVNQRTHPIPDEIIAVNQAFHDAITVYNKQYNGGKTTPWNFYKLVNVQAKPIDKTPGVIYTGPDAASFYQSNEVVETNYNLQFFSGRLVNPSPSNGTLTSDYVFGPDSNPANTDPTKNQPFKNTFYLQTKNGSQVQTYNMGGCMGCHGNAQQAGDDFSFILNVGRNDAPDVRMPTPTTVSAAAKVAKFRLPAPAAAPKK